MGIIAYAFLANSRPTRSRPADEHRFQVKYGSKDSKAHALWQDPFGLYTTLFLGVNPEQGFFVGADPVLHSPTKFFISIEFKQAQVDSILSRGWLAWERERRASAEEPVEILVGGTQQSFLRYIRLERNALGEDQGHRQLLAEKVADEVHATLGAVPEHAAPAMPSGPTLHTLAREFALSETEVLDLIAGARRLKMAVRGWVAERHLLRRLSTVPGVTECRSLDQEGAPDLELRFEGSQPLRIECKKVLRTPTANGDIRLDFQRTRASKKDPCSRYYSPKDFEVVAACLHAVTERWEFRYSIPGTLDPHPKCRGKLTSNVRLDQRWLSDAATVLREAARTAA